MRQATQRGRAKQRLKVGDCVKEIDSETVGVVVHIMREAGLVVVAYPPKWEEGIAYDPADLVKM
jgi:hypothetical protein